MIAQTYQNWECIVVDDGSTDATDELMGFYCERDTRIQYNHRPEVRPKGANACRNFGFEISEGEYVIWFDSDDIMLSDKLEFQIESLTDINFDFSVSRFDNIINGNIIPENGFDQNLNYKINAENYLRMNIFWGTIDVLLRRKIVKNMRFSEHLMSGQEYNFFSKLLLFNNSKGIFINKSLSYRRLHNESIQAEQAKNNKLYLLNKYSIFYTTYKDIHRYANQDVRVFLLKRCQSFSFRLAKKKVLTSKYFSLLKFISFELGFLKMILFNFSIISNFLVGKGYKFLVLSFPFEKDEKKIIETK